MVICDNCNVCVTKHTFCSDKCRVAYHRSNGSVTDKRKSVDISNASVTSKVDSPPKKIKPLKSQPEGAKGNRPFDICPKHKIYYSSCGD